MTNDRMTPRACWDCPIKYGSPECIKCEKLEEENVNEEEDDL